MSATYRQSSRHPMQMYSRQIRRNRWLARFPAYRLPAEMLRDNALAIGGRLVSKLGGRRSSRTRWKHPSSRSKPDQGEGLYRRSLYTYLETDRARAGHDDAWTRPSGTCVASSASEHRHRCRHSCLLNGPQYVEAARVLAERLTCRRRGRRGGCRAIDRGCLSDPDRPSPCSAEELAVLRELYGTQLAYFADDDPSEPHDFSRVGERGTRRRVGRETCRRVDGRCRARF